MMDMFKFKGRFDDVLEVNNYLNMLNKIKYFNSVIKMNFVIDYVNVLCNIVFIICKLYVG